MVYDLIKIMIQIWSATERIITLIIIILSSDSWYCSFPFWEWPMLSYLDEKASHKEQHLSKS